MKLRLMLLALVLGGVVVAGPQNKPVAKKPTKTQTLKAKLKTVAQKKSVVKKQLVQKKAEVWVAAAAVEQVDGKINTVSRRLVSTRDKLAIARQEQVRVTQKLAEAQAKLGEKKKVAARRIRSMYVSADTTVLSVLIGAENMSSFASRKSFLERIARRDHELFDEVKRLRDVVAVNKRRQDGVVAQIASLKSQLQGEEKELKTVMGQRKAILNQLRDERDELQEELEAMERESSRIEAQIRAFQLSSGGRVTPHKGRFMAPVGGRYSSPYGYRIHPISGKRKLHTGQDIAAPMGTGIRAAGSGVVISAGRRGGYGNTVIIDHGGGIATLYGHCSRIFVSAGQKVSMGDRIAAVGSTGYSTGPHLHFEVRINGSPVNPGPYIGR